MKKGFLLVSFFACSFLLPPLTAQSGSLDKTFNKLGYKQLEVQGEGEMGVCLPEGSLLMSTYLSAPNINGMVVAKLKPDGSLEPTFGTNGLAIMEEKNPTFSKRQAIGAFTASNGFVVLRQTVTDFADLLDNGKPSPVQKIKLSAYTDKGKIDDRFGLAGVWEHTCELDHSTEINAVKCLPDGGILLVGAEAGESKNSILLIKLSSNGQLDPTFGGKGLHRVRFPAGQYQYVGIKDALVQPDGKILLWGSATNAQSVEQGVVFRCLPSGGLDLAFAQKGVFELNSNVVGGNPNERTTIGGALLTADKKIILSFGFEKGVSTTNEPLKDIGLLCLSESGALVRYFGKNGVKTYDFAKYDFASGLALAPDGRIWMGLPSESYRLQLVRFQPNGDLDKTFGKNGLFVPNVGGQAYGSNSEHPICFDRNGRAYVAGTRLQAKGERLNPILVRVSP